MESEVIVAIIGAVAVVVAAIITGIFTMRKTNKNSKSGEQITQKQKGKNNTQIGVQNNYSNNVNQTTVNNTTTLKFGDENYTEGTIIIDGGNASGGGGIRYVQKNKDDDEVKND